MGSFLDRLAPFFLPPQCGCCGDFLEEGTQGICPRCLSTVHWIRPPFCSICGVPFLTPESENHPCGACLTRQNHFAQARAVASYDGSLQKMIHRWKYQGKSHLTSLFGDWLRDGLMLHWSLSSFDLILPVPLHVKRLRERGFNQALLLAKALSRRTGIPYGKKVLRKKRATHPQVNLSRREREREIRGAFFVKDPAEIEGKRILLVDDVFTTGATVNECSKVLRAEGASDVHVLTLGRTLIGS